MSTKQLRMQCKENQNELRIYVFLRQAVAPSYRPEAEEKDLQERAGLSSNVIAKMGRGESVTLETLAKICLALNCGVGDIVDLIRKNK